VTAGVYMIGRNAVLFEVAPITLTIVAVIGTLTAIFAGTIAIVQNDIKRVLAYSTVSQLGYMFLAMGVGAFGAGVFHLFTHAFFKALLFLGAGAVIHALHHEQDIRRMGGLKSRLPVTYWTFLVGSIAIAGLPPLSGFFSKDEILFQAFYGGYYWLWAVSIITSLLSATYMFRLVFLTFHGESRAAHLPDTAGSAHGAHGAEPAGHHDPAGHHGHAGHHDVHDAPPAMALVLVMLAVGSAAVGFLGVPHALGGHNAFGEWLQPSFMAPAARGLAEAAAATDDAAKIALERGLMALSVLVALAGIGIAFLFFVRRPALADQTAARFPGVHRLLLNKYYVDEIYDAAIIQPVHRLSQDGLWRGMDVKLVDGAVNGAGQAVGALSAVLRLLQTGSVRSYAASTFLGAVVILGYFLWR
jgi:NADH-quinone oxidoreductase subunit L